MDKQVLIIRETELSQQAKELGLKPCPCCGGGEIVASVVHGFVLSVASIKCALCGIGVEYAAMNGVNAARHTAVSRWNKRADVDEVTEVIAALWVALDIRENCPGCGGKGGFYTEDGYTTCGCSDDALEVLEKTRDTYTMAAAIYLNSKGIVPGDTAEKVQGQIVDLLFD